MESVTEARALASSLADHLLTRVVLILILYYPLITHNSYRYTFCMEIAPFHDYSNVLLPLPPLGPEVPPPQAGTSTASGLSFADELNSRLPGQESQSLSAADSEADIFNLATPQTSIVHNPILLPTANGAIPIDRNSFSLSDTAPESVSEQDQKLMTVCRQIEGFLLGILLKNLGKDFGGSELFNQTSETGYYQEMFFTQLADSIGSHPPGIGIADKLYDDIILKANAGSIDQLV
jgi:hypothetical protein